MESQELKNKLKNERLHLSEKHVVRLHRAISWLKCAEESNDNIDLKFVSLWIAFNSCYAINLGKDNLSSEKERFREFVIKLVKYDNEQRFFTLLWHQFSGTVRLLLENQYVFKPFWDFQRGEVKDWKTAYDKSVEEAMKYLSRLQVAELLAVVLDRLYTLRNQLIHGGATYQSEVNRTQVKDGGNMLQLLIPLIIEIMLDNKEEDWGDINYPVIDGKNSGQRNN